MVALPLDFRDRPWRDKYIHDETYLFNTWMIFGEYLDGTVGITDGTSDIMDYVPRDVAEKIVAARTAFVGVLLEHLALSQVPLSARGAAPPES